ncbi:MULTISPECIES: GNAT family N-acetyltransferase [unclassified Brenneria]|uniref:GNAT family N-acetyltransferase n=1 Tax=unclassified Brenneria TaxID=2634434 RepID=UPI0029C22391|nr:MULTISPECIES: GNAT family N-acetyltransferase [unclassified Brenneria]MDX5628212.1 GNAT family N-acetyltransferase [Brenneria sp. L3-3Z]MDX5695605.1 GNAT family N-acetyltransferase [Brenneria sp. L4-2C]MEE3662454.1 GNAT family N-acetyltransferase [Brenneria sp. g21c3]
MKIEIQPARKSDAGVILDLIIELAEYEKARHEVVASRQDIEDSLFGEDANAEALICRIDGQPVGYAVFFMSYSTWLGKNGIYLEDLYIGQKFRHCGAGKALLRHLADIARQRKCGRLEWSVLDWNQPAIDFYKSIGALPQDEWVRYRLDENGIEQLASAK